MAREIMNVTTSDAMEGFNQAFVEIFDNATILAGKDGDIYETNFNELLLGVSKVVRALVRTELGRQKERPIEWEQNEKSDEEVGYRKGINAQINLRNSELDSTIRRYQYMCNTCDGRGLIGGFESIDTGYRDDRCPDCHGTGVQS